MTDDPFLWLEDIHGKDALDWVQGQNARTRADFCDADFDATAAAIHTALDSEDRIPGVSKIGDHYYNFWRDAAHPRGIWRRTTWDEYLSDSPDWEVLLDVDALATADGIDWVFHGSRLRRPDYDRALIFLSPDGGDAHTIREFDLGTGEFLAPEDGGFVLPTAKAQASWLTPDKLLVATDFGPGSMTESSYPASARVLQRGQDPALAREVAAVPLDELEISIAVDHTRGFERVFVVEVLDFFNTRLKFAPLPDFLAALDAPDGGSDSAGSVVAEAPAGGANDPSGRPDVPWTTIDVPTDVSVDVDRELLLLRPRTDWGEVPAGGLAVAELAAFTAGDTSVRILFTPDEHTSLQGWSITRNYMLLGLLRDVQSAVRVVDLGHGFTTRDLPGVPANHTVSVASVDPDDEHHESADDFWMTVSGFLTPTTLMRGTILDVPAGPHEPATAQSLAPEPSQQVRAAARIRGTSATEPVRIKNGPELFDATGFAVTQHFATSADGTRVPYFQVAPADMELDGLNPVYQDGYGGFELSRLPGYAPTIGLGWLTRTTGPNPGRAEATGPAPATGASAAGTDPVGTGAGGTLPTGRRGVYVVANIRGGGEYGPTWHTAALRENRHRAYEDYAAVARDLVDRGVTTPSHLACAGGSNGGLLVGNMLTQYPELFGAISCGVPLLDMRRYTKLSAGASWIAEYGDPDTDDWDFIKTFSPYQLIDSQRRAAQDYPPVLFWTATSDDRVGPVQARKMAAKMEDWEEVADRVWFFEDTAGGHSAAADNRQAAETRALTYRFLWRQLTRE